MPVAIAVYDYNTAGFGARPLNDVIHRTGYWALIFLMLALAITPLRRVARFNQLVDVRRMIGVGAFVYIAAHLGLYIADQMFDLEKVASEIALRLYLTIGFVAWLGLAVLAATSTDAHGAAARRQALAAPAHRDLRHRRAGAHPFLPADQGRRLAADPGCGAVRLDDRLPACCSKWRKGRGELPAWMLLLLSVAVAALTFIAEAVGIGLRLQRIAAAGFGDGVRVLRS